jgi:hypothetical protein
MKTIEFEDAQEETRKNVTVTRLVKNYQHFIFNTVSNKTQENKNFFSQLSGFQ